MNEKTNPSSPSGNGGRRKYVTTIPTLYEAQLFKSGLGDDSGERPRSVSLYESLIIGFSGPRGGSKTASLAYAAIKARTLGLPVWSNFHIEFDLVRRNGQKERLTVDPLDFQKLYTLDESIQGGLIVIDEYQEYSNQWASAKNELQNAFWGQIRKNDLSFYYTSKVIRWVNNRVRYETDLEMECHDVWYTADSDYTEKHDKGENSFWRPYDLSGKITGRMWKEGDPPSSPDIRFYIKPLWGSYNTQKKIDVFEAHAGVTMDLQKHVITNKPSSVLDLEAIRKNTVALFERQDYILVPEYWRKMGVESRKDKTLITSYFSDWGVEYKAKAGGKQALILNDAG